MDVTRVAVIDDEARGRRVTIEQVRDMGAQPVAVEQIPTPHDVVQVAKYIKEIADSAICDHRLRIGGYAYFEGAGLVAALIDLGVPAILLTQFVDMDADSSIRKWRSKIPVVLIGIRRTMRPLLELLKSAGKSWSAYASLAVRATRLL